jgi:Sulfotransferase domain
MFRQFTHAVKYVLGRDVAGRNLFVYPDDTFLVSYPKSGSTWARFLVASLTNPNETVDFTNIDRLLPSISSRSKLDLRRQQRPRLLKSHEYFDARYKSVIYVVRDPRDVVLSQYRFFLKRGVIGDGYTLDGWVNRFITGELNTYGSWGQNVGTWLAARSGTERFLMLRYEDMLRGAERELAKIADFLGIKASQEHLTRCVEQCSAERMRELEKKQGDQWVTTQGKRKDIPFVGAAKAGGWKSELSGEHISRIESAWGPLMRYLGYETSIGGGGNPTQANFLEAVVQKPS